MPKRAIAKLKRVLDLERRALLSGDLEALEALVPEKEALAVTFEGADTTELNALSFKLAQNERLLAAATRGVAEVITTLEKQRTARRVLSTYDQSGNPTQIGSTPRATERRY